VSTSTAIALFTRDLRIHDNPMLAAAAESAQFVAPLFVLDQQIRDSAFWSEPRARFLSESLADLDAGLSGLGARLIVRRGLVVDEVCRLAEEIGADQVHVSADVSAYAQRRQSELSRALAEQRRTLICHREVVTVVAPGRVLPSGGGDHFTVFTPYFRRWSQASRRSPAAVPQGLRLPPSVDPGQLPKPEGAHPGGWLGGEVEGRRRAGQWLDAELAGYPDGHDDLAGDRTSRLSPYLHFGCLSPAELAGRAIDAAARRDAAREGAEAFVRQLAWRDFHHQVLAARPDCARQDYRPRGDQWREDDQALEAWKDGRTGIPLVDAGMRQLRAENWMHNRARMVTASFLAKTLYLDWRLGAAHFFDHLLDADIANNCLNWQWVAGTGTDSRPNRVLNPILQAQRYDPAGDYVRRWVPELAGLPDARIHRPWRGTDPGSGAGDYPPPIVELDLARERFLAGRKQGAPVEGQEQLW
jgi:deoxyribodipyrimidine photo-lyase